MAKIVKVQNGVTAVKKRNGAKRRNGVAKVTRRNGTTKAGALSFAKKNGLKLVPRSVANPKRRKKGRRRNGLKTASGFIASRRNGIFGNTKSDVKQVMSLGGGALATKVIGRAVTGVVAPYASQIAGGKFTEIGVDAVLGLFVIPMIAGKMAGSEAAKFARLGCLLVLALDAVELAAPDLLAWNPFNTSPIVIGSGGQASVKPQAVAKLAQEVASSANPAAAAAKVAGAMNALDSGAMIDIPSNGGGNFSMPLMVQ